MIRRRIPRVEHRGSLRGRLVLFVALPVGLLGLSYFLFVEYVLESQGVGGHGLRVALRIGGLSLVAIALLLAAACGFLLSERVTRPIRLLLRLAESGDIPATRGLFIHHRDWEVFLLYRRVLALVQQNQAGAKTLEELEALRGAIEGLHRDLQRTAPHGVSPPLDVGAAGPLAPVVGELESNRQRLVSFVTELRGRVARLRAELYPLGQRLTRADPEGPDRAFASTEDGAESSGDHPTNGGAPSACPDAVSAIGANGDRKGRARHAVEELRRVGTVLSLTAERMRGRDGSIGTLYDRFANDVDAIETVLESLSQEAESAATAWRVSEAELRSHYRRVEECLGGLERRLEETGQQ